MQLVNDHTPHELEGHGQQEGGHPLDRQTPGADGVQQTVLNIRLGSCNCVNLVSLGTDLVVNLGLLLCQVTELVHLPPELSNGGRAPHTLAAGLCRRHLRGNGQSRAKPRARARQALDTGLKLENF